MSDHKDTNPNYALIAVSIIGTIAMAGLIVTLFVPIANADARQVVAALTAIASAVVGGLIFLLRREPPAEPPVVVQPLPENDTEKP